MELCKVHPGSLKAEFLNLLPAHLSVACAQPQPGLLRVLDQHAQSQPDTPFIITTQHQYSFREIRMHVAHLAEILKADRNCQPGARVAILLNNSAEYVTAFLATMAAGMIAVPIPPEMEANRLQRILQLAAPSTLLTTNTWLKRNQAAAPDDSALNSAVSFARNPEPAADVAAILFTSGSTGDPKGVMLTHQNLLSNAAAIAEYQSLDHTERAMIVVPLYHALGNSILTSHLFVGGSVVLGQSIMFPDELLDHTDRWSATSISGVPEVFCRLLNHSTLTSRRLTSLRYMAVAGGRLEPASAERVQALIAPAKFYVMYGQTEATARLSYIPPECLGEKSGSIGRAIPGVSLQIVSESGEPVEPGTTGELRASGPGISSGYWNDPALTAEVFRSGWLYTGDIGRMDHEGFVFLEGRQKNFLKRFGFRMHPREVDEFLMQRLPLFQAVTLAFPRQGEPGLAVFAQVRPGQLLSKDEVHRVCASQLPRYKQPDFIEIVDEFPLNDSLKIDHQALRRRIAACA